MKVLWKSDLGQGKHDPLEVVAVITKNDARISAELVVPLDPHPVLTVAAPPAPLSPYREDGQYVPVKWYQDQKDENAGLLEVIDAQMAAIDEQAKQIEMLKAEALKLVDPDDQDEEVRKLKEWADQFPHLIEDLCMALGFARNPVGPTGIPELDILVSLAR